jgi:hypothetical protein
MLHWLHCWEVRAALVLLATAVELLAAWVQVACWDMVAALQVGWVWLAVWGSGCPLSYSRCSCKPLQLEQQQRRVAVRVQ